MGKRKDGGCKNVRRRGEEVGDGRRLKGLTALGDAPKGFKRVEDGGARLASRNWHVGTATNSRIGSIQRSIIATSASGEKRIPLDRSSTCELRH